MKSDSRRVPQAGLSEFMRGEDSLKQTPSHPALGQVGEWGQGGWGMYAFSYESLAENFEFWGGKKSPKSK